MHFAKLGLIPVTKGFENAAKNFAFSPLFLLLVVFKYFLPCPIE